MPTVTLDSKAIKACHYEDQDLTVYFTNGDIRMYKNVPNERYLEFIEAPSIGGYFNNFIRDEYKWEKL